MMIFFKYIIVYKTYKVARTFRNTNISVEAGNMYNCSSKRRLEWVSANYIPLQETKSTT